MKIITKEKLEKYFKITKEAFEMARKNPGNDKVKLRVRFSELRFLMKYKIEVRA